MPKNGILFSRAYFAERILPSPPRGPKPGSIRIPSKSLNSFFAVSSFFIFSVCIQFTFTRALFSTPACMKDSKTLL